MNDLDLAELVDGLDNRELLLLAAGFTTLAGMDRERVAVWAGWWRWKVLHAMGEAPDAQPQGVPVSHMSVAERLAIRDEFVWLADRLAHREVLCAFAAGMAEQIEQGLAEQVADELEAQTRLQAWLDERRRERPHGTRGDTSRHVPWSQASSPDDPPEPNPWA